MVQRNVTFILELLINILNTSVSTQIVIVKESWLGVQVQFWPQHATSLTISNRLKMFTLDPSLEGAYFSNAFHFRSSIDHCPLITTYSIRKANRIEYHTLHTSPNIIRMMSSTGLR